MSEALLFAVAEPPLVIAVVALLLVVEGGATAGLLVPGTAMALAAGAATQAGGLPLPATVGAVAGAAAAGGQVGYHRGRRRARRRPESDEAGSGAGADMRHARVRDDLVRRLARRPVPAVAAGPWLSAGRALVPWHAGRTGVSPRHFTVAHAPSAAAWGAATAVAGHVAGAAARAALAEGMAVIAVVVAVVVVLAVILRTRRSPRAAISPRDRRVLATAPS